MAEAWTSLRRRMGLRGDILLGLAVVDIAQAVTLIDGTPTATEAWFGSVLPLPVWSALWAAAALACLIYAMRRDDHFGWNVAIGIKLIWGCGSLGAWLLSDVTPLGGVLWLVFAWIILRTSGLAEPPYRDLGAEGNDQV